MSEEAICTICRLPLACFCQWCQRKIKRHFHLPDDKRRLCQECLDRQANQGGGRASRQSGAWKKLNTRFPDDLFTVGTDGRPAE